MAGKEKLKFSAAQKETAVKIWLDDVRSAPDGFVYVHNLSEFQSLLDSTEGEIEVMSFDNDLGLGEPEGYDIVKWMAHNVLDRWPREVRVHSSNPPAAENIRAYDAFIRRRVLA